MIARIKSFCKFLSPKYQSVNLDYKVQVKPRTHHGNPAHPMLFSIISQNRARYAELLDSFVRHFPRIQEIRNHPDGLNDTNPHWDNDYLPGLDIIGLYGMIAEFKPEKYIEIGSGNSTKVARKSIRENHLQTEIVSIDPFPRANIDHLADRLIREPLENLENNRFIIESLHENDFLFIDNSHRVFPNSDAMVCFLELLPNLRKGVIVHFHDIYLPYDYPQFMCDRFYNEQYTLAAFILANPGKYKPILPNFFISEDKELRGILKSVWEHPNLQSAQRHGGSFWLQIG